MGLAEIVGANVRRLRVERGVTQEDLAHQAGLSVRFLSGIEQWSGEHHLVGAREVGCRPRSFPEPSSGERLGRPGPRLLDPGARVAGPPVLGKTTSCARRSSARTLNVKGPTTYW